MKFIVWVCGLSILTYLVQSQVSSAVQYSSVPQVIHPRYRLEARPKSGSIARTNPPIFLIPLENGKKVNEFSFRLSPDPNFKNDVMESYDLPFAIFNPHQILSLGTWYWQYKYQDSPWSEVMNFKIETTSEHFLTPSAQELISLIPASHPRSIIDATELPHFRMRNEGSADAMEIIRQADSYLSKSPPKESSGLPTMKGSSKVETQKLALDASKRLGTSVRMGLDPLVKAYLLTNDHRYADMATRWAIEVANWDPNGVSMINNFGDSDCMLSLAMVYDACFDQLTAIQKEKILNNIKVRGHRFYHLWINNLEAKVFSGHVWQHILERLFKTALATVHDIPEAGSWLAFIYEVWQARSPVLGPEDGGWWNGSHYFELNTLTLLEIPLILKKLTGIDFFRSSFYQQNPNWLIYSFPPNSYSEGFGNGTEKQFGQKNGVLAYADALGRLNQDPLATAYAEQHFKAMNLTLSDDDVFRWFRMSWELPEKPVASDMAKLPLAKDFRETGSVNMHTDLIDPSNNLMVSLRSSPYGSTSHAHADQNSFNIQFGGQRIFYNSGYRPSMGVPHYNQWFKATIGHNTILIDGKGQPTGSGESYGWIARFLHGHRISYTLGDASMAYDNVAEIPQYAGLKKFRRHLTLLRPNIVVIYDELEADHDAEWSWLLHSMDSTVIDPSGRLICRTDNAQSQVSIVGSSPIQTSISTKFNPPPVNFRNLKDEDGDVINYKDQWHITVKSLQPIGQIRYLAIMQIDPLTDSYIEQSGPREISAGVWEIGDWMIEAELNDGVKPRLAIWDKNQMEGLYYGGEKAVLGSTQIKLDGILSTVLAQKIDGKVVIKNALDSFPTGRD